jgi:uncharacterized protein (TIGR03000 family)
MYGVVLAAALTAGSTSPNLFFGHGCWGCYGCYGCWGCYGCYGCYGGYGWYGYYPAYYPVYYYPAYYYWPAYNYWPAYYGCYGCCGGAPVAVAKPAHRGDGGRDRRRPKMGKSDNEKEKEKKGKDKAPDPDNDEEASAPAAVTLKAPSDAIVTVNGQRATRTRPEETLYTPNLKPGHTYTYVFKAQLDRDGQTQTRTRRVVVRAGQQATVDFSGLSRPRAVARVTVVTPAEASLVVNGVKVGTVKARRTFETPALDPGQKYHYQIKARVKDAAGTREVSRRIAVKAGDSYTLDLAEVVSAGP